MSNNHNCAPWSYLMTDALENCLFESGFPTRDDAEAALLKARKLIPRPVQATFFSFVRLPDDRLPRGPFPVSVRVFDRP